MRVLADTSAWLWVDRNRELNPRVFQPGLLMCDMVMLELLVNARNAAELERRRSELDLLHQAPIGPREWRRAIDVYGALAHQGGAHHRSVKHPDLLIAAAAESADAELLHYDEDFDRIAEVTGQPTRWLAPRGSL